MRRSIQILVASVAMVLAWVLCPLLISSGGSDIALVNQFWIFYIDPLGFHRFEFLPSDFDYSMSIFLSVPALIFIPEAARYIKGDADALEAIVVAGFSISPIVFVTIMQSLQVIPTPFVIVVGVLCILVFNRINDTNTEVFIEE